MRITQESDIRALLERIERIAVIGLSSNAQRPSHEVAGALQTFGYQIVPVNPNEQTVLGEKAYATLSGVPGTVDLVDVFRQPAAVPGIVADCIERGVSALWLQEGVVHEQAAAQAVEAGIDVVMNRCMYKDYRRLLS